MNRIIYIPIAVLAVLATLPFINFLRMYWKLPEVTTTSDSHLPASDWPMLGQMGDFFGGHTAAFSGLMSVLLILYFSLRQSKQQEEHFEKQLLISKQTADLTSLANIYDHYGKNYGGTLNSSAILAQVATGHRQWAIRESFSIVDPESALEEYRVAQVGNDFKELIGLLKQFKYTEQEYCDVAKLTSSLLLDKRLEKSLRVHLWKLYELLREDPVNLVVIGSDLNNRFSQELKRIVTLLGDHA